MDSQRSADMSANFCDESTETTTVIMDQKEDYISQTCSETLDENYGTTSLDNHDINSADALDDASNSEPMSLESIESHAVTLVEDKKGVIMINPQVSVVLDSQQIETEGDLNSSKVSINLESENSSCHQVQGASFGESDSVNSNYFVLVESSDGSRVISGVIPNILPSPGGESQISLNTVLQPDISYIDSSTLNQEKEQSGYNTESVTMVIDSGLHTEESQKIFIESSSLIGGNSGNISPEQLAIIEKNSEQTLGSGLSGESLIIHSGGSSLPQDIHSVQVSSQMDKNPNRSQFRIISVSSLDWDSKEKNASERSLDQNVNQDLVSIQMKEAEQQSKEEQRQLNLRLLEQSHLEHQERLLQSRTKKEDEADKDCHTEKMLNDAGIDDDTPIFTYISAKINQEVLLHVPGCQKFLLSQAALNSPSSKLTFTSEMDCTFTGDTKDFVSLHKEIKSLLKLCSPTNLVFENKDTSITENKNTSCNLLVPYVSSKGRVSKQSSKLMQLGGLLHLEEYLSGGDVSDDKDEIKRQTSGYKRKHFLSRNRHKRQNAHHFSPKLEQHISELHKLNETAGAVCQEESPQSFPKQDEISPLADEAKMDKLTPLEGAVCFENIEESCCDDSPMPDLSDPVQRRLLEEQIKCKQIYDENNRLKQMKAAVIAQQKALKQVTKDAVNDVPLDNENVLFLSSALPRSTKGRPPKKFDPSETIGKVKPRNPLTESAETKQRRIYEENVTFKFFCNQCSFKTKRQSQFDNHLSYHEKGSNIKRFCRHCDFVSISVPALKQHELLHKRNLLRCEICGVYVTDKKSLMQKHLKLKHSPKAMAMEEKYTCLQCNAAFPNKIALGRHKTMHLKSAVEQSAENTDTNNCPQCKKVFSNKIHLHRHMRDVHGPQLRPHLCDKCGRSFKRKDALQQHRIVHVAKSSRVLPYKCNKCDKAFRSQAHLKEHISIHSTERPFLCQYCGASFKTQPVQKKHILTLHIQPRTHVCAVCCRQFNTKNALQRHENTHKSSNDQTEEEEGIRPWESGIMHPDIKKMEVKTEDGAISIEVSNNVMVSLEEDQATTALVVETEGGTQVMVDPSLVPAMMGADETHSSSRANTLEVQQALIQSGPADQAFYYLADDHLQNIQ